MISSWPCRAEVVPSRYHHYDDLIKTLSDQTLIHPQLAKVYSLTEKTVQGRELKVVQLRNHVNQPRPLLMPMVKYVANMHGNEPVGKELVRSAADGMLLRMISMS